MLVVLCLLFAAHTYQFDCEYFNASVTGDIQSKQLIQGTLAWTGEHSATWQHVTIATAQDDKAYGTPADQAFMNGFAYDPSDTASTFKPDFFKSFPPMAVQAKNLVWDSDMFFEFAKRTKHMKFGIATKFESGDVDLAGSGTFRNKNVELTKIGTTKMNGQSCDVVKYDAFFNSVQMDLPGGIHLHGRSHYWGEMYVKLKSTDFISGTLYEDVLGELTLPSGTQTINVLRKGTFRRVNGN